LPVPSSGASRHLLTRKGTPKVAGGEGPNQLSFDADQAQGRAPRGADARKKILTLLPGAIVASPAARSAGAQTLPAQTASVQIIKSENLFYLVDTLNSRQKSVCASHPDKPDAC